jgi:hypothetical protein
MEDLLRRHRIDVVVNFAAESHNSLAVLDPSRFFATNVGASVASWPGGSWPSCPGPSPSSRRCRTGPGTTAATCSTRPGCGPSSAGPHRCRLWTV